MMTNMLVNMSGMHAGHDMSNMHAGHDMSNMHAGHDMSNMHSGHDMSNMTTAMPHDHHNMNMTGTHNGHGHDMGNGHDMGGMGGGMHMDMGMKMYFHTGITEYILFEDCHTNSTGGLVGACFVIFVAAILYEGLKFLREVLLQKYLKNESGSTYVEKDAHSENSNATSQCSNVGSRMFSTGHFIQTFLHVVQVFVSYCLMLVFMTYNVWLCTAVILGAGFGYFLFGWKRAVIIDANEHCH